MQPHPSRARLLTVSLACWTALVASLGADEPARPSRPLRVAVFHDAGVGKSRSAVLAALAELPHLRVEEIKAADIQSGRLADFDVALFPGGSGSRQAGALGEDGRRLVREFVEAGGGYVGVCAGAYLATCDYTWSLGILDARVIDKKHRARGKGEVDIRLDPPGRQILGADQEKLTIHYGQGPLLAPGQNDAIPDYQPLAIYDGEIAKNGAPTGVMKGTTAVAAATFGKGRVICFSPHPELTDGFHHLLHRGVAWVSVREDASSVKEKEESGAKDPSASDPLAAWRTGPIKISPVSGDDHHSIHTYFNTTPESPDGRWVLFYSSTTPEGHRGEIRIRERATGKERVLVRDVATEDAHRAACQQWVSGGRRVAYHKVLDSGDWVVCVVDVESGQERILARGRQLGFGQPHGDLLPLYGPHWNPGEHRGLELVNVETGKLQTTALTAERVRATYPEYVTGKYGERPISVFFPILSPDMKRVMFKLASPAGGDFRSGAASDRYGLLCFDLEKDVLLFEPRKWGHPAWHPDSRHIVNNENRLIEIDSTTGAIRKLVGEAVVPRNHPSFSPDGRLFVTDTLADREPYNEPPGTWAVLVGDAHTGEYVTLDKFNSSRGATSWRPSHPHPAFSPDGKRIYFNVSSGKWTRLHVAEVGK